MEDSVDSCGLAASASNCGWEKGASNVMHAQTVERWTNEKHSLYLKAMEALFVDQLYESFNFSTDKNQLMGSKPSKHKESGKFKVLNCCYRPKLNLWRHEAGVNQETGNSGVVMENRRVLHSRFSKGQAKRKLKASHVKAPSTSTSSNAEVTDQNFIDEDLEEENFVRTQRSKRRTSLNESSRSDQVVPYEIQVDNDEDRLLKPDKIVIIL